MATNQGDAALGTPETEAAPLETGKVVRYDCGWVGCDEMPMIVRRHLQEVEVGDIVEFLVREPSSKEDTPPFCRMLGHRILSTDLEEDGALVIRVARAR
jgi:TusA-related sulfurtransferase